MSKNPIGHFEIYADDPERLATFYTSLFEWKVDLVPGMDYRMVQTVETDPKTHLPTSLGAINGGIAKRPAGYQMNGSVNYVMVDSIEKTVDKARQLGARVTKEKQAVPGMGWFAMFVDPEGNHFAAWVSDPNAK
jgi:predicted enzyme related to lactoylglutathione lyase